ncbi:MAG: zinc/iron-chelating domain-containing protein [Owenweeksia sp.]|nr:zinc/iron-chelating domain-containing protein [Owenweeksia sp.]|tara:strand:- start:317 stop:802 length:486 start_codon:yes stop_codon:yes gene_type:complete
MDLHQFRQQARSQRKENQKFFKRLKSLKPRQLDEQFHELHDEVFAEINCLNCANCCKTTGPLFTDTDINRLAKHFGLRPAEFIDQYLRVDEDGDFVLQVLPCPFLGEDNYCSVYEVRPKACREYPHTDRNKMHQILELTRKNAEACPAVMEMVNRMKDRIP